MTVENNYFTSAKYFMALIQNESGYIAVGSRTINYLEIGREVEMMPLLEYSYQAVLPYETKISINGSAHTLTYVTGTTPLSTLGSLLDAFKKDEEQEAEEKRQRVRQTELARFGGEVDDELVRKIVRWRKKQAKQHQEWVGEF